MISLLEQALAPELTRLRRDIHANPELGFTEHRTAGLVADTLREIGGIRVSMGVGKTGAVGELGTDHGPTIAIRADIDALPIIEASAQAATDGYFPIKAGKPTLFTDSVVKN